MIRSTSLEVKLSAHCRACPRGSGPDHSHGSASTSPTKAWPLKTMAAAFERSPSKTDPSLWPVPRAHFVRIHALMSDPPLRLSTTTHSVKRKRECLFCSAGPNPATALGARRFGAGNRMGVEFGPRSVNRHCSCRTGSRLSVPRWENDVPACHGLARHRSSHGETAFRRGPAYLQLHAVPFGGEGCQWDSETDNDVHVNLGIRPTVPRATANVGERLADAPLHLLSDNAAFRHRHRTIR